MRIKIGTKCILIVLSIVLVVTTTTAWVSYYAGRKMLEQRISAQLNSIAQTRAAHVRTFLQHSKEVIRILTTSRVLGSNLQNLNVNGSDKTSIVSNMNQRLNRFLVESHIYNIFIVATNGRIIASTNPKYIGLDKSTDAYFIGGQKGLFIKDAYVSRATGKEGLAISAPLLDYKTETLLGVIVACVSLDYINAILNDQTGLGETGETYLLNKEGFMISQARLAGRDTFLKLKVDTQHSRIGLADMAMMKRGELEEKHDHTPMVFRDYRGVKVLGAHTHIPEMEWSLLAEMDVREAYAPVKRLGGIISLFGIIFVVIMLVITRLVSRYIVRPISDLNEGAIQIGGGDLQHRVNIHTGDEIEQLANQFNRMAEKLADSYASLEKKVAVRTQHLEHEIGARKKAEGSLIFHTALLEAQKETTLDGILVVDDNGEIISFNQRFIELWRIPRKIIDTKSDNKLLDFVLSQLKHPNIFLDKVNYLYEHKSLKHRDEVLFKDGRVFDRYSSPLITSNPTFRTFKSGIF